jgi:hypothetical protein
MANGWRATMESGAPTPDQSRQIEAQSWSSKTQESQSSRQAYPASSCSGHQRGRGVGRGKGNSAISDRIYASHRPLRHKRRYFGAFERSHALDTCPRPATRGHADRQGRSLESLTPRPGIREQNLPIAEAVAIEGIDRELSDPDKLGLAEPISPTKPVDFIVVSPKPNVGAFTPRCFRDRYHRPSHGVAVTLVFEA